MKQKLLSFCMAALLLTQMCPVAFAVNHPISVGFAYTSQEMFQNGEPVYESGPGEFIPFASDSYPWNFDNIESIFEDLVDGKITHEEVGWGEDIYTDIYTLIQRSPSKSRSKLIAL